jgi:hypothetical protein
MNKIKFFIKMDKATKLLLIEAFILLGWARVLKLLPFSKVAPSLGEPLMETSYSFNESNKRELRNISNAIHIMSRHTLWESQCLVKAIAGMKMLERRQIESTIYLGTAKDGTGKLIAHAWLRSGPFYLTGSEGMEKFTVVGQFAKKISNLTIEGEDDGKQFQS